MTDEPDDQAVRNPWTDRIALVAILSLCILVVGLINIENAAIPIWFAAFVVSLGWLVWRRANLALLTTSITLSTI